MSAGAGEPTAPIPDSDRPAEDRPEPRKRGIRCACGATRDLKPFGEYGMICPPCNRRRGTGVIRP